MDSNGLYKLILLTSELFIAMFISLTPSFHREVMNQLLAPLSKDQKRIIKNEVQSKFLIFSIQIHVTFGLLIDYIYEVPSSFRQPPERNDLQSNEIPRPPKLKDNIRARTLSIKQELFLAFKINFELGTREHSRYHYYILRKIWGMLVTDSKELPLAFLIVIIDSAKGFINYIVRRA